jgi:hypothetical protein
MDHIHNHRNHQLFPLLVALIYQLDLIHNHHNNQLFPLLVATHTSWTTITIITTTNFSPALIYQLDHIHNHHNPQLFPLLVALIYQLDLIHNHHNPQLFPLPVALIIQLVGFTLCPLPCICVLLKSQAVTDRQEKLVQALVGQ